MKQAQLKTLGRSVLSVVGEMSFTTVPDLWEQSRQKFPKIKDEHLEIDLHAVSRADSAGIALLVAWTRWARSQSKSLRFMHVAPRIQALADANQLNRVLPLEDK